MNANTYLTIRISPDEKKQVAKVAQKAKWSLSFAARQLIKYALLHAPQP
jgi:hypothetical protein